MPGASYAPLLVDGVPVTYAGYTCLEHGEQVCAEYASASETIGVWTLGTTERGDTMTYKVALSSMTLTGKIPPGDPLWHTFNGSFRQRGT